MDSQNYDSQDCASIAALHKKLKEERIVSIINSNSNLCMVYILSLHLVVMVFVVSGHNLKGSSQIHCKQLL